MVHGPQMAHQRRLMGTDSAPTTENKFNQELVYFMYLSVQRSHSGVM